MFCHKCGTQIADGSVFCQKCGTKLIGEGMQQQAAVSTPDEPIRQKQQQSQAVAINTSKKKKSGKLSVIFGSVVLIIIGVTVMATKAKKQQSTTIVDSEDIILSETYTNDTVGISFNYPDGWVILDSESEFQIVKMIDSKNNPDSISSLEVRDTLGFDPLGVFTGDEASVREALNETATFLGFWDTSFSDIPAKCVMFQEEGLKDDSIVKEYWYIVGKDTYMVNCSYSLSSSDIYEPIFDAIIASYAITDVPTGQESSNELSTDELSKEDKWDVAAVWLHTHGINDYYMCPASELGDEGYEYEESDLYFEVSGDYGTLSGIISFNNNDMFITFPVLVNPNNGEWLKADIYPIADWYDYIWARRYDDYDVLFDSAYDDYPMGYNDSLEDYSKLSGLYEGFDSSLSISIYSSQEEGETVIGNASLYFENEEYYLGEIIAIPEKDIYLVETDEGEEVLFDVKSDDGIIVIDLYVDGQYIDEYTMVEHYLS